MRHHHQLAIPLTAVLEHCRANGMVSFLGDEPKVRAAWAAAGPTPQ